MATKFDELSLPDMHSYSSWCACKHNNVIECVNRAMKAATDEEKKLWTSEAVEQMKLCEKVSVKDWEDSLPTDDAIGLEQLIESVNEKVKESNA